MSLSDEVRQFLARQTLTVRGAVRGSAHGAHRTNLRARGREFIDHRAYGPGDELREIDWRATGRAARVMVRQTEAERHLSLLFVLDAGGSMRYGDGDQSRWHYTQQVVRALAHLARHQADAIGVLAGLGRGAEAVAVPPSARWTSPARLEPALAAVTPAGDCPWEALLSAVDPHITSRGVTLIISDFLDPRMSAGDGPLVACRELFSRIGTLAARGQQVLALQLLHRDEVAFPWTGAQQVSFRCARGRRATVETDAAAARTRYLEALQAYLVHMDAAAQAFDVPLVRSTTDAPLIATLTSVLEALAQGHHLPPPPATLLHREGVT